jgi:hypothetical protein
MATSSRQPTGPAQPGYYISLMLATTPNSSSKMRPTRSALPSYGEALYGRQLRKGASDKSKDAHIHISAPVTQLLEAHAKCPIFCDGVHREPSSLVQSTAAQNHVGTSEGDEAEGVHAWLHHLPEVHVLVIENITIGDDIVHQLRRKRHSDVISGVYELQEYLQGLHQSLCLSFGEVGSSW